MNPYRLSITLIITVAATTSLAGEKATYSPNADRDYPTEVFFG